MGQKIAIFLAAVFCIGVLATPWFVGGNLPFVRSIALGFAALYLFCILALPTLIGTPTKLELWCKTFLMAGIAWSVVQIIPFSTQTISLYAPATLERLCELVLATAVFFAASHLFRNQRLLPWIFGTIALNGVLLTFFGLAQTVSESDKIFWSYELVHGGQPFGPFVNGNNAGGYIAMCFAAGNFFLALLVYRSLHRQNNSQVLAEKSTSQKIIHSLGQSFARTDTKVLYTIAAIAIAAAGVAASLSRGAIVSLFIATFVGWGLLFRRNLKFAFLSTIIVAAGIGLVFWTQQNDEVLAGLETLSKLEEASPNRIAHWNDSLKYSSAYLPFGSGLGTYSFSYMPFQESTFKRWFKYAENQYLETLAELGIPGVILLLSVLFTGFMGCIRLVSQPDSTSRAVGLSCLICLVGQSIAAIFDYAWFIPGNMFLFAMMMGIMFGQLNWSWSARNVTGRSIPKKQVRFSQLMLFILLILVGWSIYQYSAVDARVACRRFYERFDPIGDRMQVGSYQELAEYAIRIRPDDAKAHYQLALNRILQYRLAASDAMVADVLDAQQQQINESGSTTAEPTDFSFSEAWNRTTLVALHRLACASRNEGDEYLKQLIDAEPVQRHLVPAWTALNRSHELFDRFWFVDLGLAQLCLMMGEPDLEREFIDDSIDKSLGNSEVLYICGLLQHQSGNLTEACKTWNQCLKQSRDFEVPIIQLCRNEIGIREFFEQVLPSEPYFRLRIAKKFFGSEGDLLVKKLLLSHTKMKLAEHDLDDSDRNFILGEIERLSQNYPVAIAYYQQALELDKHKAQWRLQLAKALISAGMLEQAMTELAICELYHGDHLLTCQRLQRHVKKMRFQKIKESNDLEIK